MSEQFGRVCSLIVGGSKGDGLDLSDLHIRFGIINGDVQTPKTATIRVYNLAAETAQRVRSEFTQVVLQAGYDSNVATIFAGQVKQVIIGRENATDTFIEILAADGDVAYNQATINKAMAAGWTPTDLLKACLEAMAPFGVTAGQMAALPDVKAPRGRALYGMARDYLRELAETYGMSWSIVLGQLQLLPIDQTLGGEIIDISRDSGMVGVPSQTIDGIMVKCLINPQIRPGIKIRLDRSSIQEARISTSVGYVDTRPTLGSSEEYKVWAVSTSGDTRGNEWYMDLVCTAVDGTLPTSAAFTNQRGIYGS